MAKNRTTSSFLLSVSAAFVAGWLLLVTNGDVFVSPLPTSGVRATVPSWQAKQVATFGTATGSNTSVAPDQRLFKTAAAAALLCLAAARLTKGRFQKPSVARRAVVTLKATTEKNPVYFHEYEEPTAPIFTETHVVQEAQSLPTLPELISLNESPSLAVPNCADSQTVAAAATAVAPATTTTSAACLCGNLASARFAAGTRRAQHRRRQSRCASKASRRAVGRHLCERVVSVSSPPCFDASKTRTKIQLGLRVSSCMRSESGRESKLSSGVEGSEMGTCLNFVAHDLKVYMLDHDSALIAFSSDQELELQQAQLLRKHGT